MESLQYQQYTCMVGTLRLSKRKLKRDIAGLEKILNSPHGEDFRKVIKYNLSKELMDKKIEALKIWKLIIKK